MSYLGLEYLLPMSEDFLRISQYFLRISEYFLPRNAHNPPQLTTHPNSFETAIRPDNSVLFFFTHKAARHGGYTSYVEAAAAVVVGVVCSGDVPTLACNASRGPGPAAGVASPGLPRRGPS